MSREIITISKMGAVTVPTAPVWMTQFEIADLFGVFSCNIRKMIQAIYKNKELNETDTMKYIKQTDGISYDVYNFEMIIAIAFRICSKEQSSLGSSNILTERVSKAVSSNSNSVTIGSPP